MNKVQYLYTSCFFRRVEEIYLSAMPTIQRILESIPGICSWCLLLFPVIASFTHPEAVTIFIIIFALLWLLRAGGYSYHLVKSFLIYKYQERFDWTQLLQKNTYTQKEKQLLKKIQALGYIKKSTKQQDLQPKDIEHIIIVATYKEPLEILQETFSSIARSTYEKKQITVLLATEERDKDRGLANGAELQKQFGNLFKGVYVIMHPKDLPGEIPGKGGNISFALSTYLDMHPISEEESERYLVTTLDADNNMHPDYLPILSTYYAHAKNRQEASFQPLPFLCNNIWNVPLFNRLVALSSTFWHLVESGRPERLHNFSSHAQPLKALIDMNFWSKQSIVEDGHQFWRSYIHFQGNYRVIPIFIPIYQDAVEQDSYIPTLAAQYKQLRRWAYGAEDLSYIIIHWWQQRQTLPFWKTLTHTVQLLEGHIMWASAPLVLTLATKGPAIVNPDFLNAPIYYHAVLVMGYIFNTAFLGIFISMGMTFLLLPKAPHREKWHQRLWLRSSIILQWALLPISTIIFAAMPALDTQTRLLFGNKLGFNVTEKMRKK